MYEDKWICPQCHQQNEIRDTCLRCQYKRLSPQVSHIQSTAQTTVNEGKMFLITWTIGNVIVWAALAYIILNSSLFDMEYAAWRDENEISTIGLLSRYLLIGSAMGFAQWIALRPHIRLASPWIVATGGGAFFRGTISRSLLHIYDLSFDLMVIMMIVAVMQAAVLWLSTSRAVLWILFKFLGLLLTPYVVPLTSITNEHDLLAILSMPLFPFCLIGGC